MENENFNDDIRYQEAVKRVKKLKGFYIHLIVYVSVNALIIIAKALSLDPGEKFWEWDLLKLPAIWGIGLAAHGLSILLPSMILGKDWEEKKIRDLMNKK